VYYLFFMKKINHLCIIYSLIMTTIAKAVKKVSSHGGKRRSRRGSKSGGIIKPASKMGGKKRSKRSKKKRLKKGGKRSKRSRGGRKLYTL
jgi:hypothetical protein